MIIKIYNSQEIWKWKNISSTKSFLKVNFERTFLIWNKIDVYSTSFGPFVNVRIFLYFIKINEKYFFMSLTLIILLFGRSWPQLSVSSSTWSKYFFLFNLIKRYWIKYSEIITFINYSYKNSFKWVMFTLIHKLMTKDFGFNVTFLPDYVIHKWCLR